MNTVSETDKERLRELNYVTYTYLIFDFDIQHYSDLEVAFSNVKEMLDYFQNETDNTVGKIYLNYPMVEAFRDCNDFFDVGYKEKSVMIDALVKYKQIVGERGLQVKVSQWKLEEFVKLTDMNLHKANYIVTDSWSRPSYEQYMADLQQGQVFVKQKETVGTENYMWVLCGIYLMLAEYYGKRFWTRFL